jgi:hypothetical protein
MCTSELQCCGMDVDCKSDSHREMCTEFGISNFGSLCLAILNPSVMFEGGEHCTFYTN